MLPGSGGRTAQSGNRCSSGTTPPPTSGTTNMRSEWWAGDYAQTSLLESPGVQARLRTCNLGPTLPKTVP